MNKEFELKNAIETATDNLGKAMTVLQHVSEEYMEWNEKPSAVAAIEWMIESSTAPLDEDRRLQGRRSAEWYMGYEEICSFIGIVEDYVFATQGILSQAMNKGAASPETIEQG